MDLADFAPPQRAYIVRAEAGYNAFVPPPLPPTVVLDSGLVRKLSAADRAIGELAGLGRSLPNPNLLSRALMRREAVLSSRIEGTQASLSDLVLFEVEPTNDVSDVREVYNYLQAVEHVLAPDRRLPVSLSLLREAHQILLTGTRGAHATPGEFRRSQNWIGPPGAVVDTATYVPPPERLWHCLDPFEKFLHASGELPLLMAIGAIHYQFEAIHPFVDGNGRVGRLLVVLLLVEWGLLPAPLLDLSAYIEPRRDSYYSGLFNVTAQADWNGWLSFFLDVVAYQARDALKRARALQDLRERMRERTMVSRASASSARLVDALFDIPMLTIPRAQALLGVTHRAASLNIDKLVELGILREVQVGRRPRLFVAPDVMAAVETSDPPR